MGGNAVDNYGPIKKGQYYVIIGEGRDYYRVRVKGKVVNVPTWIFDS